MHVHVRLRTYIHMRTHMHMHLHLRARLHVNLHVRLRVRARVLTRMHLYMRMRTHNPNSVDGAPVGPTRLAKGMTSCNFYTYIYMDICIYVLVYIHIIYTLVSMYMQGLVAGVVYSCLSAHTRMGIWFLDFCT